jgi:spermidine/putrescine-binding protein
MSMKPAATTPANFGSKELWSRRRWLGTTLLGAAAATCGCGRLERWTPGNRISSRGAIHILVWDGYFSAEILGAFEQATGIRVHVHTIKSNDELVDLLNERKFPYDLAMPSDFLARHLHDRGMLKAFTPGGIPNLAGIDLQTHRLSFDPKHLLAVPYIWGSTGIGYNSRRVEGLPKSWADLFRHERRSHGGEFAGVSVLDDAHITIGCALIHLGFSPNTRNHAEIDRAGEVLMRVRDQISFFESNRVAQLLALGSVDLAMAWSGDVTSAMKGDRGGAYPGNKQIRLSLPSEGSILFRDCFVVPRHAARQEEAEQFLNFILDPRVAAEVTNHSFFATTVPAATRHVNRMLVNGPTYFIHPAGAKKNFTLDWDAGNEDAFARLWARLKADPSDTQAAPAITLPGRADT